MESPLIEFKNESTWAGIAFTMYVAVSQSVNDGSTYKSQIFYSKRGGPSHR